MSDLAFNVLGNLAYSYGRNPDVIGMKDGVPVNANGEQAPLMKQPNLIGRMFNPMASRAMEINDQVANAPLLAQQQSDINNKIAIKNNWDALSDQDKAVYSNDPRVWIAHTGGAAQNNDAFNTQGTAALYANNGGRQLSADRLHNETSAASQEAANRAHLAALHSIDGMIPEQANTELSGTQLQGSRNAMQLYGLPKESSNYFNQQDNTGLGLSNNRTTLLGQQQAGPYQADTNVKQSMYGNLIANQDLNLSDATLGGRRVGLLGDSAEAQYGGHIDPVSMYTKHIDPLTGRVSMVSNPFNPMNSQNGTPVPGLPGAMVHNQGALPVTESGQTYDNSNPYAGSYGVNQQSQSGLIQVDNLHAVDSNKQIYYNQGTPNNPQYIPIKTASADLQQKAIDTLEKHDKRAAKIESYTNDLRQLRKEHTNAIKTFGNDLYDTPIIPSGISRYPIVPSAHSFVDAVKYPFQLIGQGSNYLTE